MNAIPAPPPEVAAAYEAAPEPQRSTMLAMRARILEVVPDAVEVIKYRMPTFMVGGVAVAGLMANKRHVGYYPYSGSVVEQFPDLLADYGGSKGALHVPVDKPLSKADLRRLLEARLAQ